MAGTIPFLRMPPAAAATETRTAQLRLTAGTRTLAINGKSARVFGLIGPNGKPGITLSPGERFHVDLVNEAGTSTIVHWHGQLPPWMQDGFPWPQTPPIPAGDAHSYDYAPIAGTYWMHSHQGMQEQSLMTAPLIVRSAEDSLPSPVRKDLRKSCNVHGSILAMSSRAFLLFDQAEKGVSLTLVEV